MTIIPKALGRPASRAPRCAPRSSGTSGVGGRPRRPRPSESTSTWAGSPNIEGGWIGGSIRPTPLAAATLRLLTVPSGHRSLPRRSLWSRLASLATDHSGRAGALRTASARSVLKCMCPRRQRVSPSLRPLQAFAFQRLVPPPLSRTTPRRAFAATVALDTGPQSGPDTSGHIPLAARSGRVGARCWLIGRLGRERERTDESVGLSSSKSAMW